MSNLLQLQKGTKSFGGKVLFDEASFSIDEGEHVGVIGPNGAGKSTLFRILTEEESLDSGEIIRSRSLRLGYLVQHDRFLPDQSVESYLTEGARIPIWDLKSLGKGLGLSEDLYSKPILSLSGGFRMRCKLLYLISQDPNLMLLDEPTNYLDLETLLVLESFLQNYRGAFLLISHDREFLRRTTDHTLEVEGGLITKFNGGLDSYFEQKRILREQLEAQAQSIQQKREAILEFVSRFGAKATKASQAQSKLKMLEKLPEVELTPLPVRAHIRIPPPISTGKTTVQVQGVDLGYGSKTVLKGATFELQRGDHLGVVGVNGAGKSTLLKGLAGTLKPQNGELKYGNQVYVGYYAQHVSENLNPDQTVLEALAQKAHKDVLPQDVLDLAGSLLFSGDDTKKKISVLSGGEKSRVALGQILLQKAPFLLLDEPTNHLDFDTVEALTLALMKYEGTIIVISHDRSFIGRVASRILEIRNGRVQFYPGNYQEYLWSLEKGSLSVREFDEVSTQSREPKKNDEVRFNYKEQKKELDRKLKSLDKRVSELESRIEKLDSELIEVNNLILSQPGDTLKLSQKLGDLHQKKDAAESEWLDASEERESVTRQLKELIGRFN